MGIPYFQPNVSTCSEAEGPDKDEMSSAVAVAMFRCLLRAELVTVVTDMGAVEADAQLRAELSPQDCWGW